MNQSCAIAANVYLLLYPRGPLERVLAKSPELGGLVFSQLQAITAEHLMGEGRVYGGGLHKLEPRELSSLSADAIARVVNAPNAARRRKPAR